MINTADLHEEIAKLKVIIVAAEARDQRKQERIDRLEKLVADFKRALFGHKSEKANPEQYNLGLEDVETAMAAIHAEDEAIDPAKSGTDKADVASSSRTKTRNTNRGSLPSHLPRVQVIVEPGSLVCSCGSVLHAIGEDVSERLDIIPARFEVIVTRRPKYACRSCTDGVVQAPAPARQLRAARLPRRLWRMCWSANMPIICCYTARHRFTAAKALILTVQLWRLRLTRLIIKPGRCLPRS